MGLTRELADDALKLLVFPMDVVLQCNGSVPLLKAHPSRVITQRC